MVRIGSFRAPETAQDFSKSGRDWLIPLYREEGPEMLYSPL
jgi:hypothetical protein